jgi:hypothetical protein
VVNVYKNAEINESQLEPVKPKRADLLGFSRLFACILLNIHFNWKVFQVQGTHLN